jgi:hypothetical protein
MRYLRAAILIALASTAAASTAEALTIRDIVELSRAGVGEDVLLALIEVDRGVYPIDAETLKTLKSAGVSERVIVALVRSGREPLPEPEPLPVVPVAEESPAPQPQVVVIEHQEPVVREVLVPVYVTFPSGRAFRRKTADGTVVATERFIPFQSAPPPVQPVVQEPRHPVYWGFGGKRRPDTWDPPRHHGDDRRR